MSAIEELPFLRNIEVILSVEDEDVPISGFKNLTSLCIRYPRRSYKLDHAEAPVLAAIAASPQLKELIIDGYPREDCKDIRTLLGDTGIPLQSLQILGISISMPLTVGFRGILSNLKRLTLYQQDDLVSTQPDNASIAWEELWSDFYDVGLSEGVRLETLHTSGDQGPAGLRALFIYLLFQPGLKGLVICMPPSGGYYQHNLDYQKIQNHELATQFWQRNPDLGPMALMPPLSSAKAPNCGRWISQYRL